MTQEPFSAAFTIDAFNPPPHLLLTAFLCLGFCLLIAAVPPNRLAPEASYPLQPRVLSARSAPMIKPLIDVRTFQFKFHRYAETEVINLVGLAEGTHFFIWTLEGGDGQLLEQQGHGWVLSRRGRQAPHLQEARMFPLCWYKFSSVMPR